MKRAYWFLVMFGIWCTASAVWYMFAVKGIPTDPRLFNPHVRLVAITEILLMLLVACLIGYAIGIALREGPMESLWQVAAELEGEKKRLLENERELTQQLESARQILRGMQQSAQEEISKSNRVTEGLTRELADAQRQFTDAQGHLTDAQRQLAKWNEEANRPSVEVLEHETSALRFRTKQLEFQNQELEEAIRKLNHELEVSLALHSRKSVEPMHPFVRPVTEDEKDDLTVIKGIGPFIEKRLNMVGIYTLKQISEFTPESIEQVTKAIEFFPNRMVRDNWVGQARALVGS